MHEQGLLGLLKISPLSRVFNRQDFDCGSESLNTYLKSFAFQSQKKATSRTYVLHSDEAKGTIFGFYTLVVCTVSSEILPEAYAKKYKPNMPGVNLARLGVNKDYQGQGYGAYLMSNALSKVLELSEIAGAAACFVDAKEGARDFYVNYGFIPLPSDSNRLFLPIKTIKALFTS